MLAYQGCSDGGLRGAQPPLSKSSEKLGAGGNQPPLIVCALMQPRIIKCKEAVKNRYFTKGQPLTTKPEKEKRNNYQI